MAARADMDYLMSYNSLLDEHLGEYLSRPAIRRHLRRQGLIKAGGVVVGEEEWRAVVHRREAKEKMNRDEFEQQRSRVRSEEMVRMEAKRKHRQQLQNNYGVADRIRLQAERHHPAYVRERNFTPLSRVDSHALGIKPTPVVPDRDLVTYSVTTTKSSQSRVSCSLRSLSSESPYIPKPPNRRSSDREYRDSNANLHRRKEIRQVYGGTPRVQSKATITILYKGRGIKLNGKLVQEGQSDVSVYQQHCGGNAVLVYQGFLAPGTRFSFLSRRHLDSTLGLTFYLGGLVDARLSACCEYRYKPGHRVGGAGKTCHYEWVSAKDAAPCIRCQAEIEIDKLAIKGESAVSVTAQLRPDTHPRIREAWVNTSLFSLNPAEDASYSSTEFDEASDAASLPDVNEVSNSASIPEINVVSNSASIPEINVVSNSASIPEINVVFVSANGSEDTVPENTAPNERSESVSRRTSISTASDTSSVSLDSNLDDSQSDAELRPDSAVSDTISSPSQASHAFSSSLGYVTPDDRLLAPSTLTGISPSISEEVIEELTHESLSVGADGEISGDRDNMQMSTLMSSPEIGDASFDPNTPVQSMSAATNTPHEATIPSSLSMVSNNDSVVPAEPYAISGECLVISRNLTDPELEDLAYLLQENTIYRLVLENTRNFTPSHLETLFNHIIVLKKIQITRTELAQDQFTCILPHLKEIQSLEISHSIIPPDHLSRFMKKLATAAPKLANFDISSCNIHFDNSTMKSLNSIESLTYVNLSGNVLNSAIPFDSLHLTNLQELHLDNTNLQEPDLLQLCHILCTNTTIHTLSLQNNRLSKHVLQKLLDLLQENRTIKQLFFTPSNTDESQTQRINVKLITDILDKRAI